MNHGRPSSFSAHRASAAVGVAGAFLVLAGVATVAQQGGWYPSRWGANDQRGAANRLTSAKVLEARNLITKGTVYQLGRVYEAGMPIFGTRHYSVRIPQVFGPFGKNEMTYHDEIISGELGQIGTQFDGLGHAGIGDLFYNGNRRSECAHAEGLTKLGIENAGAFVTRGVLVDVARYNAMAPGVGVPAAQWLVDEEITLLSADTWGIEVFPNPDASLFAPVHQLLLARNGIYILENIATEELARDGVYELAFVFAPLRLKGATGSPGNPIAIR